MPEIEQGEFPDESGKYRHLLGWKHSIIRNASFLDFLLFSLVDGAAKKAVHRRRISRRIRGW